MAWRIRGCVFARLYTSLADAIRRLNTAGRAALLVVVALYLAALFAPIIAPYEPSHQLDIVALKNQSPTMQYLFGTDRFSRDVFSRVLYGARVSLSVATLAVLVSAIVGTCYGLVAAISARVVDSMLMRMLDALLSIPRVLLLIAILALWNPVPLPALVLLLGLTGWFHVSRLVRAEALTLKERDFVLSARSLGAGRIRIMLRHLLPNVLAPVLVATTLGIGNVIVLEAGLSFIGIGVREPDASWGTMFQAGTEAFVGTWWAALFPGAAIVLTVLCINILGDALRGLLDPRHVSGAPLGTLGAAVTTPGK
jgi:peptide/nickel transport system permease protein